MQVVHDANDTRIVAGKLVENTNVAKRSVMMKQAVWMFATQGFGNLWPLGIGFFLVQVIPPIATAYLGAFFGR